VGFISNTQEEEKNGRSKVRFISFGRIKGSGENHTMLPAIGYDVFRFSMKSIMSGVYTHMSFMSCDTSLPK
jgi:hypothetical protein